MIIEKRKRKDHSVQKKQPVPADYTRMVQSVLEKNFDQELTTLNSLLEGPYFSVHGNIFLDEIVLSVSLLFKDKMNATTIHTSIDYDPHASRPTAEDLLSICLDASGALLQVLFEIKHRKAILDASLSSFEDIPFEWTETEMNKKKIFVRVDRTHPEIEKKTEEWLSQNDPQYQEELQKLEEEQMEAIEAELEKGKFDSGDGNVH
ncbi:MAG: hypothetical protein CL678_06545 [Bdellovibrionaceae bacterium]|nr:hypothetical protein [Pseudobdellovibrionaceae bacterium]|tara:strand:+ start:1066 stop:1680 length:615 start_codon:yes stop_codon:yes gene_type:complete